MRFPENSFWVLGVAFSVISSLVGGLSSVLIRCSHLLGENSFIATSPPYLRACSTCSSPIATPAPATCASLPKWWANFITSWFTVQQLWLLGLVLASVVSPVFSAVSVAAAPASVVIALAPLGLVVNVAFARVLLGEQVLWNESLGCLLIASGVTGVLSLTNKCTATLDEVQAALVRRTAGYIFIAFGLFVGAGVALSLHMVRKYRARKSEAALIGVTMTNALAAGFVLSVTAGVSCGTTTLSTRVLFTALEGKSWWLASEALSALAAMAVIDLTLMAQSLAHAPAVVAAPLRVGCSFVVGTFGSLVVLQEEPRNFSGFALCMAIVLGGIGCLALRCIRSRGESTLIN